MTYAKMQAGSNGLQELQQRNYMTKNNVLSDMYNSVYEMKRTEVEEASLQNKQYEAWERTHTAL